MFRQLCRRRIDQVNTDYFQLLNQALKQNNTVKFWRTVKRRRNTRRSNASIDASSLSDFYRSVMTDTLTSSLTDDQIHVRDTVSLKFNELLSQDEL